jgi:hypothetical protein
MGNMGMRNKELIEKLKKIGKLPTSNISDETDFPLKEFDNLLQEFTLPIDFETALQLVNLSPPVEETCYEVEWALIHLVENNDINELQKVLDNSEDGEVKRIIQIRLDNYNKKKNSR